MLQQAVVMVNLKGTERRRGSQKKGVADVGMQARYRLSAAPKILKNGYWLLNDAAVKFDFTQSTDRNS
jgi:hypothetical protein